MMDMDESIKTETTTYDMATRYAQSTGHLQGVLIWMALNDNDITPAKFKLIYDALERATELSGGAISEYDRGRFVQRAETLGITL